MATFTTKSFKNTVLAVYPTAIFCDDNAFTFAYINRTAKLNRDAFAMFNCVHNTASVFMSTIRDWSEDTDSEEKLKTMLAVADMGEH